MNSKEIPCETKFYLTAQEMLDLLNYLNPVLTDLKKVEVEISEQQRSV